MTIKELVHHFLKSLKFGGQSTLSLLVNKDKLKYFFLYLGGLILIFFLYNLNIKQIDHNILKNYESIKKTNDTEKFADFKKLLLAKLKNPYEEYEYTIENNDSIQKILKKFNIKSNEINDVISELKEEKLTNIYSGRQLKLVVKNSRLTKGQYNLINLYFPQSNTSYVEVKKLKDSFVAKENIINLKKEQVVLKGKIDNNLYSAAMDAGIEPNVIVEFARIYGFEIDFQRDIRKGDEFEIFYEKFLDNNDKVRDTGKIIYASMKVNRRDINLYNFNSKNNEEGYYDINGKSIVKSLMKTPINGARLSSSFGMRKHPILGFSKMHTGTDFAAPMGTPIMASGDGVIKKAGWCGGGGNCVVIRHNSTYQTVYAHMSKFAQGIRSGIRVKQAQVIGYVGSTGKSTGPHLHYEVIVNGERINSQTLKLPSGKILKGNDRKIFETKKIKLDVLKSEKIIGLN